MKIQLNFGNLPKITRQALRLSTNKAPIGVALSAAAIVGANHYLPNKLLIPQIITVAVFGTVSEKLSRRADRLLGKISTEYAAESFAQRLKELTKPNGYLYGRGIFTGYSKTPLYDSVSLPGSNTKKPYQELLSLSLDFYEAELSTLEALKRNFEYSKLSELIGSEIDLLSDQCSGLRSAIEVNIQTAKAVLKKLEQKEMLTNPNYQSVVSVERVKIKEIIGRLEALNNRFKGFLHPTSFLQNV